MPDNDRLETVKSILREGGRPPAPTVEPLITEVRSEGVANVPIPPGKATHVFAQAAVVEWRFRVRWAEADDFHKWLAANEATIDKELRAAKLKLSYRGTYLVLGDDRHVSYRTFWSYDHPDDFKGWDTVNQAKTAGLKKARELIVKLRGYWCRDPDASEHRYAPAYLFAKVAGAENAFLAMTLDAAKQKP